MTLAVDLAHWPARSARAGHDKVARIVGTKVRAVSDQSPTDLPTIARRRRIAFDLASSHIICEPEKGGSDQFDVHAEATRVDTYPVTGGPDRHRRDQCRFGVAAVAVSAQYLARTRRDGHSGVLFFFAPLWLILARTDPCGAARRIMPEVTSVNAAGGDAPADPRDADGEPASTRAAGLADGQRRRWAPALAMLAFVLFGPVALGAGVLYVYGVTEDGPLGALVSTEFSPLGFVSGAAATPVSGTPPPEQLATLAAQAKSLPSLVASLRQRLSVQGR